MNGQNRHPARFTRGVPLQEFVEKLFDARISAMEKAVDVAKITMESRLEGMNEFRAALTTQASTFLPRTEYALQHLALEDKIEIAKNQYAKDHRELEKKIEGLENLRSNINGRLWAMGVGGVILLTIFEVMLHYVLGIHTGLGK